jgi:FkbM family methyltransferase
MREEDRQYWFNDEQEIRDRYWHIQPGQVVMDIGCHIGSYSIPALKAGAAVYAVDPAEGRLEELRRIWDGDPARLVTIPRALAGDGGYTPEFRASLGHAAYAEFHAPADARFSTLDVLAAEYALTRLDWVKIDVEGAELGVLTGGLEALARFRPALLIEAHDKVYKFVAGMGSERKCHDLLTGLGYEIEVVPYYGHDQTVDRDFWVCRPGGPYQP